jgi:predicted transcriptional regulator
MAKKTVPETPKTTTIRVDAGTHKRIVKLSETTGRSIVDLAHDAVVMYERQLGRERAAQQLIEMKKDPVAWQEFIDEIDAVTGGPIDD